MNVTQIIAIIMVLLFAIISGFMISKKSKKYTLVKWIGLFIIISMFLTWIFKTGEYTGITYALAEKKEQGLIDLPYLLHQAFSIAGDKIVFLLTLGAFYGVLRKIDGYKKLVLNIAKRFEDKEIEFVLIISLLLSLVTALFTQTFTSLVFVPFLITILLNMKFDKVTTYAVTFGSIMVGLLGTLYGSEGLYWFNQYASLNFKVAIVSRFVIYVIAYILFNIFLVLRTKKVLKKKAFNEIDSDPYKVEEVDKKVKTKSITIIFIILLFVLLIGFINWNYIFGFDVYAKIREFFFNIHMSIYNVMANSNITNNFNSMMSGLSASSHKLVRVLAGTEAERYVIGSWTLYHASFILLVTSYILSKLSKVSFDNMIDNMIDGAKKMLKPIMIFSICYIIMLIALATPYIATINNIVMGSETSFSIIKTEFMIILSSIFQIDLGYTGYLLGKFYVEAFSSNVPLIYTMFTTLYGLVGFIVPTQVILVLGLSYLDIELKDWFKYIWKFVLIMFILLLIIFAIIK